MKRNKKFQNKDDNFGSKVNNNNSFNTLNHSKPQNIERGMVTGIKNGTLTNPYRTTSSSPLVYPFWASVQTYGCQLKPTGDIGSLADSVFQRVVYPIYSVGIQKLINFNFLITLGDLVNAIESVSNALQLYYTVESIVRFTDDPTTQNSGMDTLRIRVTPEVLYEQSRLKQRLEQLPCPPNLLKCIYWLYQTYSSSADAVGATIYKLTYNATYFKRSNFVDKYSSLNAFVYNDILNDLSNSQTTLAIIAKAMPHWIIKNLPESKTHAIYDDNWLTMWTNLGSYVVNDVNENGVLPQIFDYNTGIPFVSKANNLDGSIPCFMTMFRRESDLVISEPGLLVPNTNLNYGGTNNTDISNRTFPSQAGLISDYVYGENQTDVLFNNAGALYGFNWNDVTNKFTTKFYTTSGIQRTQGFTVNSLRAQVTEFMQWLLNSDDFKTKEIIYNVKSSGK